jgi:hypothetical protein
VLVAARGDGFGAETEDLGPGGCLLVSPRLLSRGAELHLAIEGEGMGEPLSVLGRVAWAEAEPKRRAGVAFASRKPGTPRPAVWFERLLRAQPGMASRLSQAPARLEAGAPLYLMPPPRHILDLASDEADVLRRIENGVTARALLDARPGRAEETTRVLFSLFEKRILTLALGQSAPAWRWREILDRLDQPELDGSLVRALEPPPTPPGHEGFGALRARPRSPPAERPAEPPVLQKERPGPAGAPPGEASERPRPPEAQRCLALAREAAEEGNVHTAIGLLRRALQLSPRDEEIASLLGSLVFARDC